MSRCNGSSNTVEDPLGRICVPDKMEDVNLQVFNMIIETNESTTLTKHVSYECRCDFDDRKCNSRQKLNNDKCQYKCKKTKRHRKSY